MLMPTGVREIIASVRNLQLFGGGVTPSPLPYRIEMGSGSLCVVTGNNASGKCLFRRAVSQICNDGKILCIETSMYSRTSSSGIQKLMMHGDEREDSTGWNSAKTFQRSLLAASSERSNVLFLDEPDMGLSDDYAAAMGGDIANFVSRPQVSNRGVFVVSHNRYLVAQLKVVHPFHVHFGRFDPPMTLDDWLSREVVPRPLSELIRVGRNLHGEVSMFLNH